LPADKLLTVEDRVPFTLHLGFDGWQRVQDWPAQPGVFGIWSVALSEQELAEAQELNFARQYESGWEDRDYRVSLERRKSGPAKSSATIALDDAVAEPA
jgi:glucoamylase